MLDSRTAVWRCRGRESQTSERGETTQERPAQIARLDERILLAVREHGGGGVGDASKAVGDAESAVEDLAGQVEEIGRRAASSEAMVEDMCRGIR